MSKLWLSDVREWRHSSACTATLRNGACDCGLDRLRALLDDALPDTLVAIAPDGQLRVVVPAGTVGRYTLAVPHDPAGVA